uniref:Secreted protein n=1 Tax=Nelumbo nucifera TaxID=4432 RepID=A0A822YNS8_NELNU|nr:TPA_asm: hypothetical protein HUJ06_004842 [Nelumbo nucifera]
MEHFFSAAAAVWWCGGAAVWPSQLVHLSGEPADSPCCSVDRVRSQNLNRVEVDEEPAEAKNDGGDGKAEIVVERY